MQTPPSPEMKILSPISTPLPLYPVTPAFHRTEYDISPNTSTHMHPRHSPRLQEPTPDTRAILNHRRTIFSSPALFTATTPKSTSQSARPSALPTITQYRQSPISLRSPPNHIANTNTTKPKVSKDGPQPLPLTSSTSTTPFPRKPKTTNPSPNSNT